jgi:hypothetical protein
MATAKNIDTDAIRDIELDKELSDVLFAISVITRQLAKKITVNHRLKEEKEDAKAPWTYRRDSQR